MTCATIFALSSGLPPAAIAVIRISGAQAGAALRALAGRLPAPRRASVATLRDPANNSLLDTALLLWLPGPNTATGEDLAEIHAHGGRAVVHAIERVLSAMPGLRLAQPGEFTRRAFDNGRLDLAEAEGLADLLSAETESQRRQALALAGGELSARVAEWQDRLLALSAATEAVLDFSDEDDVAIDSGAIARVALGVEALGTEWDQWLGRPHAERLRDGVTVAIAGPPNSGKSTLINALAERDAAIVSSVAGTTRDIVEVPLALNGIPFRLADTAGLRAEPSDAIEAEGIVRARQWLDHADIILWLGSPIEAPAHPYVCRLAAQADRRSSGAGWTVIAEASDIIMSAQTGEGMGALREWLTATAQALLPREGEVALNRRHADALDEARSYLRSPHRDPLLLAEQLRGARIAIDRITGTAGTEAMLDALFGRFCIGK